jgi:PAS domain S-box-containing protein
MNEAAEMLFLHDFKGRICEVNRAAIEGTGYTREELLGLSVDDIDHEAAVRNDYEQLWQGLPPGGRACIEARHWRKDGSSYPAEVRLGKVVFDGQDYILALASDISDRKLAEQRQRESEKRLNTLLANLPGMAYRCANDPDWTMEFVSEGVQALTGYTHKDLIGRNGVRYASLIHPADRRHVWTKIQEALEQDRAFTLEYRIQTRDGQEKWVWEKGRCVDDKLVEGFITDVSDRKRYEQTVEEKTALENQLHHLQKADSLSRMAGAIAHHFNNKLCGVLACLELVRMQAVGQGGGGETVDIAIDAATKAADISKLMLRCLGQSRLERHHIDLSVYCHELRPELASSMPETVLLDLSLPEESIVVWADAEALRQIVTNLVTNAWEAEGTTRVELRVTRMHPGSFGAGVRYPVDWVPSEGAFVVIEVTDDGAGMSATMVEQIFDPFFTTKFTGRGIGLPLVLGLARSHGGGVIVDSKAGEGTVFRVCLPAAGDVTVVDEPTVAQRPSAAPAAVSTVLLVEDEAPLRELAGMMIQSLGGRVISAGNGKEALQKFEQNRHAIDLVFCDIRMPYMDGWQVLAKLRKADPTLPVVFATAYDDAAVAPDGYIGKPDAILRKPYLIKDVQGLLIRFATTHKNHP